MKGDMEQYCLFFWAETNKVKRLNLLSNVIMYTYDKETEVFKQIYLFFVVLLVLL